MGKEVTDAVILDVMDYRETSRFITVYTQKFGKLTLISKGIRKIKSPMTGRLEPFTRGTLQFYLQENRTLYTLNDFQPSMYPAIIRTDYVKIVSAFLITEIAQKITMELQENTPFFNLIASVLDLINAQKNHSLQDIIRIFELKSIILHGYQPNLETCTMCQKNENTFIWFSTGRGGVICPSCAAVVKGKMSINPGTVNFIKKIAHINNEKIGSIVASQNINRELKKINREIFHYYFEREFQSGKLLPF